MEQVEEWLLPVSVDAPSAPADDLAPLFILPFAQQPQMATHWCWIAIASSMSAFYKGLLARQCNLASLIFAPGCCAEPTPEACDKPGSVVAGMQAAGVLRASAQGRAQFPQLAQEIVNGHPVGVGIIWATRLGGHAVTLFGYLENPSRIQIGDPWFGESSMRYPEFPGLYQGGGIWHETGFSG